jgi:hypothetical protein
MKIASGIADLIGLFGLVALNFNLGLLSRITRRVLSRLGEQRGVFLLSLVVVAASVLASGLGWFIREDGRKPWTVYGLLYPEELITSVPIGSVFMCDVEEESHDDHASRDQPCGRILQFGFLPPTVYDCGYTDERERE